MMKTISAVIPTYNCAKKLVYTLRSISWVNEIIVVDMFSTDETIELAKKYGAKVYQRLPPHGNFDKNREWGMKKATTDWILKIDSDEEFTPELNAEINNILMNNNTYSEIKGINLKNKIYMFGKEIRHGFIKPNSSELRIVRRNCWKYNPYRYHQQIASTGKTLVSKYFYIHNNYFNVKEFINKTNRYTSLDCTYSSKRDKCDYIFVLLAPIKTFIKLFILQEGFIDGKIGFETSILFSIYNLIEKVKIYEYQKNKYSYSSRGFY